MPVDRPTFSESWYRVASLRPRLRSTVQTYRQYYRGQMWHVVRDPGNNQFFRLDEAGYRFVAMLDGQRSVEQVWQICNHELGDQAPTQPEIIQLLGQLYTSNLLASELPADAAGMFERYKKRIRREIGSYIQNLLFIRIPLYDPDAFLDRWVSVFGLAFTKAALVIWLILLALGITAISDRFGELVTSGGSENLLDPDNLIWLYLSFAVVKGFHEFGHAFSCKKFGRDRQSGGEVHTMGIMFLVFMPVPYVDASSSWALRNKWQRITIGAAGMYVELGIAAIAAMIWNHTQPGVVHAMCFNIMFIASVSSLLFNGNPLLRFDAYYILSDLLEIPNLAQRGKEYMYYLTKRYVYGVRQARNPSHSSGERFWLVAHGVSSFFYRIIICVGILLFVSGKAFIFGVLLALAAVVTWVLMPLGKWAHYLANSADLIRTRQRAVMSTAGSFLVLFVVIGVLPFEEHHRAPAVVEPANVRLIFMGEDGFIYSALDADQSVNPDTAPLVTAVNPNLQARYEQAEAELDLARGQLNIARRDEDWAVEKAALARLSVAEQDLELVGQRLGKLSVTAPISGIWVPANGLEQAQGVFMRRGEQLGVVPDMGRMIVRAVTGQHLGPRISIPSRVALRVSGRPDQLFHGRAVDRYEAGQSQLPYVSLGYAVRGGSVVVATDDDSGRHTAEQFFEVRVEQLQDEQGRPPRIFPGQRVVARFGLGPRPLAFQWWRQIRQMIQRRFHTTF